MKPRPLLLGVLVTLAACALRLALIKTSHFCGDEAEFWVLSRAIAQGRAHTLLGTAVTSGAARHPGPAFFYLMALSQLFSRTPEAANAYVALMGGLGVGLYWDALRRPFGEAGAFLAAGLMACAPWSALFADRIWNPNLLSALVLFSFWAACRVREDPSSWLWAPLVAVAMVMPQIHLSSPAVMAALVVLAWPGPGAKASRGAIAAGVLLGLSFYLPYLVSELHTGFANSRAFLDETGAQRTLGFALVPVYVLRMLTLDVTYQLLNGSVGGLDERAALRALFDGTADIPFSPLRFALFVASLVLLAAALEAGGVNLARALRERRFAGSFLGAALTGFAVNVALLALTGKAIFGHYVAAMLPFYFVVFAPLGRRIAEGPVRERGLVALLAGATAAGGIDATLLVSREVDARNGLSVQRSVLARIYQDLAPGQRNVALYASFYVDPTAYYRLAEVAYRRPLYFWGSYPQAAYAFELATSPPREDGTRELAVGPVVLYRVDPR